MEVIYVEIDSLWGEDSNGISYMHIAWMKKDLWVISVAKPDQ